MLRNKGKYYPLLLLLFALALAVAGVSMWRVFGPQAEQTTVDAINLQSASTNINALSDDEFDTVAAELYTEFAMGTEEDPKAHARWFWEQRSYPANQVQADIHREVISTELQTTFRANASTATWQELGPAPLNDISYAGQSAQDSSGRALSVVIHPTNSNIIFIGAAQGGIWKSTNGGQTFRAVADDAPSLAIKVIRIAASNSNIMYAGTGEPHDSTSIYGQGVLKSTDGGETWSHLPSSGSGWDFEDASVSGLQIHPTDPNTVYVTTAAIQTSVDYFNPAQTPQTGIFKSTNGGTSWTMLKAATNYDFSTVSPSLDQNVGFMDLELAKSNPNLLYATEYFGGIYKSTNGGDSWSLITPVKADGGADFPAQVADFSYFVLTQQQIGFARLSRFALNPQLPEFTRIEIGLAQSDPNVLYAGYAVDFLLLDGNGDGNFTNEDLVTQAGLLFKTSDGGATWSWLGDWTRGGVPEYCGNQCAYDNMVEVNPTNANDVIIGGNANYNSYWPFPPNSAQQVILQKPWSGMVYRSVDGGTSWVDTTPHCAQYSQPNEQGIASCSQNDPTKVIHPDIHGAAFDPNNANRFFISADGGLYRATFTGSGANSTDYTWANLNNNLSTLQFYFFGDHPTDANKLIGGLQDNSVAYWNGNTWEGWGFGDGTFGAFDPQNPQIVYMGSQGAVHRHDNGGAKEALDSSGEAANGWKLAIFSSQKVQEGDSAGFLVPFEIDPVTPSQVYAASVTGLYRSTDRGDNWSSRLNPVELNGRPTTISVSPANNSYVWVGTSTGAVYLFNFQAGQVSRLDLNNGLPARYVTKIQASPNNANTVYVTYSGYNANTPTTVGKVFKSTNLGQSWGNISGNLPDVPVSAFALDPQDENRLWVGSDVGVYITENGGSTWTSYRRNMPVVAIMDMKYNKTTGYLNVVTHGRGAWRINPAGDTFNPTNLLYLPMTMFNYDSSTAPPAASVTPTPQGAATATPTATQPAVPTATQAPASTSTPTATQAAPTATQAAPTATQAAATATPQPSATPTQASGGLPTVQNGDFESGPGVGWTGSSTNSSNLIYDESSSGGFPAGFTPRSGSWVAWLGGFHNEIGDLSQTFTIPTGESVYLHYYYQLRSEDLCGYDLAYVLVNETIVASGNLCLINNVTSWTALSVDMSAYAGQTVTIHFRAVTDGDSFSNFFVDDVSFQSTPSSSSTTNTMGQVRD